MTKTYSLGFLRTVDGYATKISYQGSGMVHEIQHANGVTYTTETDPSTGLERPHRIKTTAGWDTGVYRYDGAGNIHQIGTQKYRYDRLNRLVSGEVLVGAALVTKSPSSKARLH